MKKGLRVFAPARARGQRKLGGGTTQPVLQVNVNCFISRGRGWHPSLNLLKWFPFSRTLAYWLLHNTARCSVCRSARFWRDKVNLEIISESKWQPQILAPESRPFTKISGTKPLRYRCNFCSYESTNNGNAMRHFRGIHRYVHQNGPELLLHVC